MSQFNRGSILSFLTRYSEFWITRRAKTRTAFCTRWHRTLRKRHRTWLRSTRYVVGHDVVPGHFRWRSADVCRATAWITRHRRRRRRQALWARAVPSDLQSAVTKCNEFLYSVIRYWESKPRFYSFCWDDVALAILFHSMVLTRFTE